MPVSDPGRDLVLEYRAGRVDEAVAKIILVNTPGQRYSFGTSWPGEVEGEEFLFCRGYQEGIVGPSHCTISVDGQGQFYIETNACEEGTFVNEERMEASESRLLKTGDIISLGVPLTKWPGNGPPPYPIYHVKERVTVTPTTGSSGSGPQTQIDGTDSSWQNDGAESESPFDNDLILSKIVAYLPFEDLKTARQVSKKWEKEASKALEKKDKVSFTFGVDYVNPAVSTRIFRYLKEMEKLKIQNLNIFLATTDKRSKRCLNPSLVQNPLLSEDGEPGEKLFDDFRTLLQSSHNFISLSIRSYIQNDEDFSLFYVILREFGEELVELKLQGEISSLPSPAEIVPRLKVLGNLRKFSHEAWVTEVDLNERWVDLLVPLLPPGLEHFSCSYDLKEHFLKELLQTERPNLKGLQLPGNSGASILSEDSLRLLLQLKRPLTSLKFYYRKNFSESGETCELLEALLLKNSSSLQTLVLTLGHEDSGVMEVKFPPCFPKLEELEVESGFGSASKIVWSGNRLDYKEMLPSLKKLTVKPPKYWFRKEDEDAVEPSLLNSFFPADSDPDPDPEDLRCETVTDLWVAALRDPSHSRYAAEEAAFQKRMDQIRKMFPNALNLNFHQVDEELEED